MQKHAQGYREYLLLNMNVVIRFLILSDIIWVGALGFLSPIFALFISDYIQGSNATVAGVAATIYLFTKSIFQIPFASIIDRIRGEHDDFNFLFFGSVLAGLIPLGYLFIDTPIELYFVQFIYGLVMAATFPSFMAIFTRHIDKSKEGSEWGIYFTLVDFASAISASVGGIIAVTVGFKPLILIVVMISLIGNLLIWPIRKKLYETR